MEMLLALIATLSNELILCTSKYHNNWYLPHAINKNQAFTILAALLTKDLPVLNSFSVKLSQFFKLEVMNI